MQQNMNRLNDLVKELGAQDRITLAGRQSDVESYYLRSKIFAFTSSSEGFPNVIGEAMSAGLPVISFDCVAGPSDMITDGENGFLIPLFDYRNFERKLHILMHDKKLREKLGANSKASIRKFAIEGIGEQFYSFITAI
jgi:GalNAc-alpha-(1->4)-GalNAc-alpha-(1->3)-diNAcBac-PP-undecaprenol alpha-1,4-N-acetyl-D-galactosaminyltransferase